MIPSISDHSAITRGLASATQSALVLEKQSLSEFLAFRLGLEEYGLPILSVQEIRSYEKPTGLAGSSADLLGVLNLRGVIVPIIDLRLRLCLAKAAYDAHTVVIVVNVAQRVVGLVVDGVSDVLTLQPEQMRPVPELDSDFASEHLSALGFVGDRMLILLNVEKFLAAALGVATGTTRS